MTFFLLTKKLKMLWEQYFEATYDQIRHVNRNMVNF